MFNNLPGQGLGQQTSRLLAFGLGNGPCPGPGPCGPPGEEEPAEREPGGRQFYDQDKIKQRRLHEQIMREDHEIEEFLRTLLSKGIL